MSNTVGDLLCGYKHLGIDWNDANKILTNDRICPFHAPPEFHKSDFGACNPYEFCDSTLALIRYFLETHPDITYFTVVPQKASMMEVFLRRGACMGRCGGIEWGKTQQGA